MQAAVSGCGCGMRGWVCYKMEKMKEEEESQRGGTVRFIRNVPVSFPFNPYDCQMSYMEKVIQALQQVCIKSSSGEGEGWVGGVLRRGDLAKLSG